ncbi:HAD-like domain-containing protein [Phycomyces nitens]|nr:HAD-like domain-containing protein [Phycomyces nitens]
MKGLLIDLSGTIHIESKPIAGAVAAINRLRASKVPFRFATNTTQVSSRRLVDKLNKLGFNTTRKEVFTSLSACRDVIESQALRPLLLLESEALEEFDGIDTSNPNAVVIGLAPSQMNYEQLNKAFRLVHQGVPFYAIHKGRYMATADGNLSLGPGGFVQAIEYATGVSATVIGKPNREFFLAALRQIGMEDRPQDVAMVGDDVQSDLGGGAVELGIQRCLVSTGKYRPGDEAGQDVELFGSIVDVVDKVLSIQ